MVQEGALGTGNNSQSSSNEMLDSLPVRFLICLHLLLILYEIKKNELIFSK